MACLGTTEQAFDPHYNFQTEDDYRRFLALHARTWFFGQAGHDVAPVVHDVTSDESEEEEDDQEKDKEEEEEEDAD